jgi:hypothetical protein
MPAAVSPEPPLDVYRRRLEERRATATRLARIDTGIAWSRLVTFVALLALGWLALKADRVRAAWLSLPAAAFLTLIVAHDRVIRARERAERAARLYEDRIARIEDRPPPGDGRSQRFADEQHVYANDLDLFGPGSLFERLSTARTSMGEETFAAWMKAPATPAIVRARQQAVAELAPKLDLKEDLAVMGMDLRLEVNPRTLASWASAPAVPLPPGVPGGLGGARIATALLGAAIGATLLAWLLGRTGLWPLASAALLGVGLALRLRAVVGPVLVDADRRAGELKLLALLLARLEREAFATPLLDELRRALETAASEKARALPPSRRVARLAALVDLLDARRNQIFAIISAPLLWTTQLALAVEAWRRAYGPAVGRWLAAVGEIEALGSLASYSYEHPELPFPTVLEDGPAALLDGEGLGHPLIPARTRVTNDVALGGADVALGGADVALGGADVALGGAHPRLLIVSGSNMSGKSTLLRTVGANVVLALAGGPVCARRLTLSRFAIGATLRIHDSLQEGRSRFYAEITRLRQIVDLGAGEAPALFLLDELLSGTNSHDRRTGAEAILRGLLARNGMGLATTHDLALTEMAAALGPVAANVHFEDELVEGQMRFDYRMRPGVVRKSNALALMRAIGLDVPQA